MLEWFGHHFDTRHHFDTEALMQSWYRMACHKKFWCTQSHKYLLCGFSTYPHAQSLPNASSVCNLQTHIVGQCGFETQWPIFHVCIDGWMEQRCTEVQCLKVAQGRVFCTTINNMQNAITQYFVSFTELRFAHSKKKILFVTLLSIKKYTLMKQQGSKLGRVHLKCLILHHGLLVLTEKG